MNFILCTMDYFFSTRLIALLVAYRTEMQVSFKSILQTEQKNSIRFLTLSVTSTFCVIFTTQKPYTTHSVTFMHIKFVVTHIQAIKLLAKKRRLEKTSRKINSSSYTKSIPL